MYHPPHVQGVHIFRHSSHKVQHRDSQKQLVCERDGITLIVIPYWWNTKIESIAHAIHTIRPDIHIPASLLTGDAIPKESKMNRDRGETISRSFLLYYSSIHSSKVITSSCSI